MTTLLWEWKVIFTLGCVFAILITSGLKSKSLVVPVRLIGFVIFALIISMLWRDRL